MFLLVARIAALSEKMRLCLPPLGESLNLLSLLTLRLFIIQLWFVLYTFWPASASLNHLLSLKFFLLHHHHPVVPIFEPIYLGVDFFN